MQIQTIYSATKTIAKYSIPSDGTVSQSKRVNSCSIVVMFESTRLDLLSSINQNLMFNFSYLRAQNPYAPPKNVPLLVDKLKESANLTTGFNGKKFSLADKFDFLTLCGKEFNHTVPNSVLHEINTMSKFVLM